MSGFTERHGQSSNIQWGRIVAGAAITTGVVLVGLAIGGGEVPILSDIAEGIKLMATSIATSVSNAISGADATAAVPPINLDESPSMFAQFGTYLGKVGTFLETNAKALGGAALLGAGLGYMTSHSNTEPQLAPVPAAVVTSRLQNAQMGFAAREQMRAVNALMQSRMQAFGQNDRQV